MLSKMKENIASGDVRNALIIGQNLFSKNPGDTELFGTFYSVLWSLISSTNNVDEKQHYFQQLSSVLTAFSESVTLDDSMVEYIKSKEDSLNLLFMDIQDFKKQQQKEFVKEQILHNDDCLKKASQIIEKLEYVPNKKKFDTLLQQLQDVDYSIEKEYLTDRQKKQYESETQKCSKFVDNKVRKFEREKNVEYNSRALEAYEKVFRYFRELKVTDDHRAIIKGLFEFDATKLFNETLTYYNHVYSYVLSKLNDDEKFILTKAAIHCETRR